MITDRIHVDIDLEDEIHIDDGEIVKVVLVVRNGELAVQGILCDDEEITFNREGVYSMKRFVVKIRHIGPTGVRIGSLWVVAENGQQAIAIAQRTNLVGNDDIVWGAPEPFPPREILWAVEE